MESMHWHSYQQKKWIKHSVIHQLRSPASKSAKWHPTGIVEESPASQTAIFAGDVQLIDFKNVMKRIIMIAVGLLLFVAGYQHINRQTEYITAKSALSNSGYATTPAPTPAEVKPTTPYRLIRS